MKYGIPSPSTVLTWKRKYDNKGLSGLNDGSRIWSESMVKEDDTTSSGKKENQNLDSSESYYVCFGHSSGRVLPSLAAGRSPSDEYLAIKKRKV
jgi:hypothetical protein